MSASTPVQPLGALLSSALAFVKQYQKPVLFGAVLFGTVAALIGGTMAHSASSGVKDMMQNMGLDSGKMQELSQRLQNGDQEAATEMQKLLTNAVGDMNDGVPNLMRNQMIARLAPFIGISAFIAAIVSIFAHAYFLLLALSPTQDAMAILKKTPQLFWRLLGLWIWMFIRSFAWIPLLGLVPAIIFGPRFVLAPVILLQEKKGIMESVSLSYERTSGFWGKIVGNIIVAALCIMLAGIAAGIVSGIVGMMIPFVGMWLNAIVKEVLSAFMIVFVVQLAFTVMENSMMDMTKSPGKKK